jgi:phage terminase large subunit GpA-like protein
LDCRVYARAAAWIAEADRWTEAMWRDLEQQVVGLQPRAQEQEQESELVPSTSIAGVLRRRAERRNRRVFWSSYLA